MSSQKLSREEQDSNDRYEQRFGDGPADLTRSLLNELFQDEYFAPTPIWTEAELEEIRSRYEEKESRIMKNMEAEMAECSKQLKKLGVK